MITFEEAYKKAKDLKPNIDNCTEYKKGFIFGSHEDDDYEGGYGHTPVVILKKDGSSTDMPYFIGKIGTGRKIREIPLPKE